MCHKARESVSGTICHTCLTRLSSSLGSTPWSHISSTTSVCPCAAAKNIGRTPFLSCSGESRREFLVSDTSAMQGALKTREREREREGAVVL